VTTDRLGESHQNYKQNLCLCITLILAQREMTEQVLEEEIVEICQLFFSV